MRKTRQQLKFAFLDMPEIDSRPLRSAIGNCSSLLNCEIQWSAAAEADICIADVLGSSPPPPQAVVMLYAREPVGKAVDLVRPVRIGALIEVLKSAMQVLERRQGEQQSQQIRVRSYRGAVIQETASTLPSPRAQEPALAVARKGKRMYRGQPVLD